MFKFSPLECTTGRSLHEKGHHSLEEPHIGSKQEDKHDENRASNSNSFEVPNSDGEEPHIQLLLLQKVISGKYYPIYIFT